MITAAPMALTGALQEETRTQTHAEGQALRTQGERHPLQAQEAPWRKRAKPGSCLQTPDTDDCHLGLCLWDLLPGSLLATHSSEFHSC